MAQVCSSRRCRRSALRRRRQDASMKLVFNFAPSRSTDWTALWTLCPAMRQTWARNPLALNGRPSNLISSGYSIPRSILLLPGARRHDEPGTERPDDPDGACGSLREIDADVLAAGGAGG